MDDTRVPSATGIDSWGGPAGVALDDGSSEAVAGPSGDRFFMGESLHFTDAQQLRDVYGVAIDLGQPPQAPDQATMTTSTRARRRALTIVARSGS
jgi:hypothetical protein